MANTKRSKRRYERRSRRSRNRSPTRVNCWRYSPRGTTGPRPNWLNNVTRTLLESPAMLRYRSPAKAADSCCCIRKPSFQNCWHVRRRPKRAARSTLQNSSPIWSSGASLRRRRISHPSHQSLRGPCALSLSIAWRAKGDEAKAAQWQAQAVGSFKAGDEGRRLGGLLASGAKADWNAVHQVSFDAELKSLLCIALAQQSAEHREELAGLADKLSFRPTPPAAFGEASRRPIAETGYEVGPLAERSLFKPPGVSTFRPDQLRFGPRRRFAAHGNFAQNGRTRFSPGLGLGGQAVQQPLGRQPISFQSRAIQVRGNEIAGLVIARAREPGAGRRIDPKCSAATDCRSRWPLPRAAFPTSTPNKSGRSPACVAARAGHRALSRNSCAPDPSARERGQTAPPGRAAHHFKTQVIGHPRQNLGVAMQAHQ